MSEAETPKKARFRLPPEVARGRRARRGGATASPAPPPTPRGPPRAQPPNPSAPSAAREQPTPGGSTGTPTSSPAAPADAAGAPATKPSPATGGEAARPPATGQGPATPGAGAGAPEARRDVQDGLQALWADHASSGRRLLSGRALTELQLRASFDPFLIKPSRVRLEVLPGSLPDCQACDQPCCVGLENTVSLRLVDIARLIDLGREDLIQREKPHFPTALLRRRPALRALVESELWQRLPVMRQRGPQHICAALTPNLRCSLHPHWPTSCERFPYFLRDNRREVAWGRSCPHKRVDPAEKPRSEALFQGAIAAYNERVKDAVLLAHAPAALDALGIGAWITPARAP